uniref:Salivary lipocalin n=1 Tax=Strongyloides papillosus TaxID=174720 RepID=A0A0N5B2T7_STREA
MKYIFASIVLSIVIFITINGNSESGATDTSSETTTPNWQLIKGKDLDSQVEECASLSINYYNKNTSTNYTVGGILKKEQAGSRNGLLLRVRFNATSDCLQLVDTEKEQEKPCTYDLFFGRCKILYTNSSVILKRVVKLNLTDTTRAKEV